MKEAGRTLGYLTKTSGHRLIFGNLTGKKMCGGAITAPPGLMGLTDSSWGDEKPASGYAAFYKGALIAWASKRCSFRPCGMIVSTG